jgi:hypothetical protein
MAVSAAAGQVLRQPLVAHPPEIVAARTAPSAGSEHDDDQYAERQADGQPHKRKTQDARSNTTVWASRFGLAVLLANIHESE